MYFVFDMHKGVRATEGCPLLHPSACMHAAADLPLSNLIRETFFRAGPDFRPDSYEGRVSVAGDAAAKEIGLRSHLGSGSHAVPPN